MRAKSNLYVKWLQYCVLIWLVGCASPSHKVLKSDYIKFAENYGDASNQQLLLNLARLANDEPVNFLQLGSFSSQYQFGAAVGFTPTYVHNSPGFFTSSTTTGATPPSGSDTTSIGTFFKNVLTLGGSATANVTATPIFQFLPLTGSNLVTAVLSPISDKVFYTFYDQGYPGDLVARTMIASVAHITEITTNPPPNYDTNKPYTARIRTNFIPVLTNNNGVMSAILVESYTPTMVTNPPPTYLTNYEYYVNDPHDRTYPDFLAFCSTLYRAQISHILTIGPKPGGTTVIYNETNTRLTDVVAAVQANLSAKYDTNTGQIKVSQLQQGDALLGNTNNDTTNVLKDATRAFFLVKDCEIGNSKYFVADTQAPVDDITNLLHFAEEFKDNKYVLKMRTVEAAMYTVAKEEPLFRAFNRTNTSNTYAIRLADLQTTLQSELNSASHVVSSAILYGNDVDGPFAIVTRINRTKFKVRPLMKLTCKDSEEQPRHIVATISFDDGELDRQYCVGDVKHETQDRTVFTMLSYLFAQAAISTQNLPVQQLIQVQ